MTSPDGDSFANARSPRRLNPFPDRSRPLFRPAPAELVLWLLFAALTLVMVCFHEPWRDEAQQYVLVRDTTLPELVRHMKYESQFLLWYLLSWLLVRLCGFSIFGLALVHWAVSCCTAYLILRRAPFRLLTRAALVFSVMFAFEFTVISRHYAIGVFLLAVLLVNWRERFRRPILYACGIAVCASTNLPVWACLGGLCVTIGCEAVVRKRLSWRVAAAMLIVLFGFALAMVEIYNGHGFGSPYVSYRRDQVAGFTLEKHFRDMFAAVSNTAFFPLFQWDHQAPRSVKAGFSALDWCLLWLLVAGFFSTLLYFAWKSVSGLLCFATNAFLLLSLQYIGGFHSMRHVGFLLVGTVAACWIASVEEQDGGSSPAPIPRRASSALSSAAGAAAALLLFMQVFLLPSFVWSEIKYPFSHGYATARFILGREYPADIPIYCLTARSNVSILPWLPGRAFYIFDQKERDREEFRPEDKSTYSKWGRSHGFFMDEMADAAAAGLKPGQFALFVVAMNEDPNMIPSNMILQYDSSRSEPPVWGPYVEEFKVYAVVRPDEVQLYRPDGPHERPSFIPEDARIREAPSGR